MSEDGASASAFALPTTSLAAGYARRHVAAVGATWPADLRDVVELLTSELVTNALRYGHGSGICLTVVQRPDAVRVEVQDANPATPRLTRRPEPGAERGRGLHLVDRLASRWGHTPSVDPLGKIVWFEIDHRPASAHPD